MDSTSSDPEQIKNWYRDAKFLKNEYRINVFPTLLFFTPDAKLVHSVVGFQNLPEFIRLTQLARDPRKPILYLLYEKYKHENINDSTSRGYSNIYKKTNCRYVTASKMAAEYKYRYMVRTGIVCLEKRTSNFQ